MIVLPLLGAAVLSALIATTSTATLLLTMRTSARLFRVSTACKRSRLALIDIDRRTRTRAGADVFDGDSPDAMMGILRSWETNAKVEHDFL